MSACQRINEHNIVLIEYTEEGKITEVHPAMYTSVGTYPLFYITNSYHTHMILCPHCAHERKESMDRHINYEIQDLYCDECEDQIESAYME